MKAYQHTSTPVSKSQEDIKKILIKYGASGVQFLENWQEKILIVKFLYIINTCDYFVIFKVPIPQAGTETATGRPRAATQTKKEQEQFERGIWRAIFWAIKSRMESIEFGIETFQEAFLSHFEIPGSNIQIGEILIPRLEKGNLKLLNM